jgi:hypothetical protein
MSSVSKDENTTKQTRTRNRNRRRTNITNNKENRTDSRGRRKGGENVKKKNEGKTPTETPVIGSSNPFFIAVCAPDTYASSATPIAPITPTTPTGGFQQRVKPNVFLRPRSRAAASSTSSSFTTYATAASTHSNGSGAGASAPNRFIHHPALQQSRNTLTTCSPTTCSPTTCSDNGNNVIPISDLTHFPSLSATTTDAIASVAPVKLNFKEMMTRSAGGTSAVAVAVAVPVPVPKTSGIVSNVVPQKALSSTNIFLAAFQPTMAHTADDADDAEADDADADDYIGSKPVLASSVLIDTCDKKYDRLYR